MLKDFSSSTMQVSPWPSTESQVSLVIFNEEPTEKNVTGLLCQKEKAVFIKHLLPYCSAAAFCQVQRLRHCQESLLH